MFKEDILLPTEHFGWGIQSFASIAIVAVAFAAVATLLVGQPPQLAEGDEGRSVPQNRRQVFGALLVMGLFGGVVGFHGGNSRVGVVGDLMPAVVALLAGLAAYLFDPGQKAKGQLFPMLGVFACTLFVAYSIGSANRSGGEEIAKVDAQCLGIFGNAELLTDAEGVRTAARLHAVTCPLEARLALSEEAFEEAYAIGEGQMCNYLGVTEFCDE